MQDYATCRQNDKKCLGIKKKETGKVTSFCYNNTLDKSMPVFYVAHFNCPNGENEYYH